MRGAFVAFDIAHRRFAFFNCNRLHGRAHGKLEALLFENSLEGFLHLTIHAGGDVVQILNDLNLSAQTRVDRSQFQTNDTSANHHHFAWNFTQGEGARRGDDGFLVDLNSGQARRLGACCYDDVLGFVNVIANFNLAYLWNAAPAFQPINFVFLKKKFDALGVAVDHIGFVTLHLCPIDLRIVGNQAHFCKIMLCFMQLVAGMQQGFGGNAANIQAGAPQRITPFDTCGFETQLCASNSADIAARAGANHNYIIRSHLEGPLFLFRL